jgi:hypothetical protein
MCVSKSQQLYTPQKGFFLNQKLLNVNILKIKDVSFKTKFKNEKMLTRTDPTAQKKNRSELDHFYIINFKKVNETLLRIPFFFDWLMFSIVSLSLTAGKMRKN